MDTTLELCNLISYFLFLHWAQLLTLSLGTVHKYKKYSVTFQTRPTQIVNDIFLIGKTVLTGFWMIIGIQK